MTLRPLLDAPLLFSGHAVLALAALVLGTFQLAAPKARCLIGRPAMFGSA